MTSQSTSGPRGSSSHRPYSAGDRLARRPRLARERHPVDARGVMDRQRDADEGTPPHDHERLAVRAEAEVGTLDAEPLQRGRELGREGLLERPVARARAPTRRGRRRSTGRRSRRGSRARPRAAGRGRGRSAPRAPPGRAGRRRTASCRSRRRRRPGARSPRSRLSATAALSRPAATRPSTKTTSRWSATSTPTRASGSRATASATMRSAMVSARRSGCPAHTASAKRSFSLMRSSLAARSRRARAALRCGRPGARGPGATRPASAARGSRARAGPRTGPAPSRRPDVAVRHEQHATGPTGQRVLERAREVGAARSSGDRLRGSPASGTVTTRVEKRCTSGAMWRRRAPRAA